MFASNALIAVLGLRSYHLALAHLIALATHAHVKMVDHAQFKQMELSLARVLPDIQARTARLCIFIVLLHLAKTAEIARSSLVDTLALAQLDIMEPIVKICTTALLLYHMLI